MPLAAAVSATWRRTSTAMATPSGVVGTAYFLKPECRMPQRCVAPQSRATASASSRRRLPRAAFSRSPLEMSVSASRPIEKLMPMPFASSWRRVKSTSIDPGSSDGASMKS